MASGAQLTRWGTNGGVPLLTFPNATNVTAVASAPQYGTIGVNDSGWFCTPIAMSKIGFQLLGNTTGLTVSIYATLDPQAYLSYQLMQANEPIGQSSATSQYGPSYPTRQTATVTATSITIAGNINGVYTTATVPSTSWILVPGPSEQSGTGLINNPVTSTAPFFFSTIPFVAWRAVVTAVSSPTGSGSVVGFAIP